MTANGPLRVGDRLVGCVVDVAAAEFLWKTARAVVERRQVEGLAVDPAIVEAVQGLRATVAARYAGLSAGGHGSRTSEDMKAPLSTSDLAGLLGVSPRHTRRLASVAGVRPLATNLWPADAAGRIEETRTA